MTPQTWGFASGTRTRNTELSSGGSLTVSNHPFMCAITCELRPIEIGVTNRTRTGTDAVTGRNAADYIMATEKWRSHVDLHHEPPPSQSGVQN